MKRRRARPWLTTGLIAALVVLSGCTQGTTLMGDGARPTGIVAGAIEPCVGASLVPVHFVSGTVVARRGSETTHVVAPGEFASVLPRTEVASQTVGDRQHYHFALTPGHDVLHVVRSPSASELPSFGVSVDAHRTVHANMPDECQ